MNHPDRKGYLMQSKMLAGMVVAALVLQGCVGTATVIGKTDQASLQSLQLFGPDEAARFTLQLACTSEDASCVTVEHAFSGWADDRHIAMQMVEPGDASFTRGRPSTGASAQPPYRVAIRFAPLVVASFNKVNFGADGSSSGDYKPPRVSYTATLYVFDAASGKLLQQVPYHEQRTADFKADAGDYLRVEVKNFIASLDPAYTHK